MLLDDQAISSNGVQLFCKTGGKGHPVIFVNGGPGLDLASFLPQVAPLALQQNLILYDQRCCGQSTGYPYEASIRLPTFVEDLEGLRTGLSLSSVALVGFSFGGLIAMAYTIAHPDVVSHLILLDSVPGRDQDSADFSPILRTRTPPSEQAELDRLRNSPELAQGSGAILNQWLRLRFRPYFFDETKLNRLKLNFTDQTAAHYTRVADLLPADVTGYDLFAALGQLKVPALILQGDYDPVTPKMLENTHNALAGSQFEIIRDAGHFSYVEQTETVLNRITKFIGSGKQPADVTTSGSGTSE
jgi:proline iminopeptidase